MLILKCILCACLTACVNSRAVSMKPVIGRISEAALEGTAGHISHSMLPLENRPQMEQIQAIIAVGTLPTSSRPTTQLDTTTGSKDKGFRRETTSLPHLTALKSNKMKPQGNVNTSNILSSLSQGVSMTGKWLAVRERGRRGDAQPLVICIKTTQAMIFDKLRQLHPDQKPDEVEPSHSLSGLLVAIDEELAYLQENIRADCGKEIWDMSRVVWIGSQIVPELEELVRLLFALRRTE